MNKSEETVSLDLASLCVDVVDSGRSPIDDYYADCRELLSRSSPMGVPADHSLLSLLLLDLVSSAELYFRRILGSLCRLCPITRTHADRSQQLLLGSVGYYDSKWLSLAVLEHASLSSKSEIKNYTNKMLSIQIPDNTSLAIALEDFDKVCQVRHAVVHAKGWLWYRNVSELGIEAKSLKRVQLSLLGLQGLVAKTHNAVRAYNNFISNRVLESWIARKVLSGRWTSDRQIFEPLYDLFLSKDDAVGEIDPKKAYEEVRTKLRT